MNLNYQSFFQEEDEDFPTDFWGNEGAGALFIAKDTGKILLFLRSHRVREGGTWNLVGGRIDEGENPKEAVAREIEEETGFNGSYQMSLLYTFQHKNFKYYNFLVLVPFEFSPELNEEHYNFKWVEYGDWPTPLHFGLNDLFQHAGSKIKRVVDLIKKKKDKMVEDMDTPPPQPPAIVQKADRPTPSKVLNQQDLMSAYIVAATLIGEASIEGRVGMHAVLNVIMNRAKGDFNKAKNVVLQPAQFSTWNNIDNPAQKSIDIAKENRNDKTYREAIKLVDLAMKGNLPDITGGATFYINPKKAHPSWVKKMTKTKIIGRHHFYKPKQIKKEEQMMESSNNTDIISQGLIDDGIYGYVMKSQYSYLRYGYEPNTKIFYLLNITTPSPEDKHKGYAKALLENFFKLIKQMGGTLDPGIYTTSGEMYIKHVVERLAKQYNVRLVKGRDF